MKWPPINHHISSLVKIWRTMHEHKTRKKNHILPRKIILPYLSENKCNKYGKNIMVGSSASLLPSCETSLLALCAFWDAETKPEKHILVLAFCKNMKSLLNITLSIHLWVVDGWHLPTRTLQYRATNLGIRRVSDSYIVRQHFSNCKVAFLWPR